MDEFHVDLGSARTCADTGIFARARSCATSVCPHVRRYGVRGYGVPGYGVPGYGVPGYGVRGYGAQ